MRIVEVIECRVASGAMREFVNAVQQWERSALSHPAAPVHHSVLVEERDPGRVAIVTEFEGREMADEFRSAGLIEDFISGVLSCVEAPATVRRYDLFYAAGDGVRAIFGEKPHSV